MRISYSYLFRIQIDGLYLLVKDEQGRNNYHPVGGVYKFYQDQVDIADEFDGEYDGIYDSTNDTQDDLRLKIKKRKLKKFNKWFYSAQNRESITDLSREFVEELLDTNILSREVFSKLQYKYVGSCSEKSFNSQLNMRQVRHFDVFNIKLTNPQKNHLNEKKAAVTNSYVFATERDIQEGYLTFGGKKYDIADSSKLVLIKNASALKKEFSTNSSYSVVVPKS